MDENLKNLNRLKTQYRKKGKDEPIEESDTHKTSNTEGSDMKVKEFVYILQI